MENALKDSIPYHFAYLSVSSAISALLPYPLGFRIHIRLQGELTDSQGGIPQHQTRLVGPPLTVTIEERRL